MRNQSKEKKNAPPIDFEVWVRALANELGPAAHNYVKNHPGSFEEATEYLLSDEVLNPTEMDYPAFCLLDNGDFTEGYLSVLFATAYQGHTVDDPLYGDEIAHFIRTDTQDPNDPDQEWMGEFASFAGILYDEHSAQPPKLIYYKEPVPVREFSARNLRDLWRIHEIIISAAMPTS